MMDTGSQTPSAIVTGDRNAALFRRMEGAGVSHMVVGGAAVAVHGCRDTMHFDELDILIDPTIENARGVIAVLTVPGVYVQFSANCLARPSKRIPVTLSGYCLDILTPSLDEDFADMLARSVPGTINGLPVRVIGRADLIAMKKVAAANSGAEVDKHQQDLDCLLAV
jgi:hypothetical protein